VASGHIPEGFVRTHLAAVRTLAVVRIQAARTQAARTQAARIQAVRSLVVRSLVVRSLVVRIRAAASSQRAELVEVAEVRCLLQAEPWVSLLLVEEEEVLAVVAFGQTLACAATTRTTGSRMRSRRVCARAVSSGSAREGVA
jgi:hypothetical protein